MLAIGGAAAAWAQGGMPPVPTAPNALTLQQVVEQAKTKNPTLLSAQQNLLSVKAQEIQAGVRQNPYLAVEGSNVTISTSSPAGPYFYSVQLSRLFERGQKRRWRLDSATSTTDQTRDQYALQEQQTILTVKQAFTTMLLAKSALKTGAGQPEGFPGMNSTSTRRATTPATSASSIMSGSTCSWRSSKPTSRAPRRT